MTDPTPLLHLPARLTVHALGRMGWQQFERLVAEVLASFYRPYGLHLKQTKWTRDEGRDAEGIFVLGPAHETDDEWKLRLELKLWVEAKQRHRAKIGRKDLSAHLVAAVNRRVNKIIFVTNVEYTVEAKLDIEEFSERVGLPHSLIDGPQLIRLARDAIARQAAPVASNQEATTVAEGLRVRLQVSFARDVHGALLNSASTAAQVQFGEPFFLILDGVIESGATRRLALTASCRTEAAVFTLYSCPSTMLAAGDRFRSTFAVWGAKVGKVSAADLAFAVEGGAVSAVGPSGAVEIVDPLLADWLPPSRRRVWNTMVRHVERWIAEGDTRATVLVGAAGSGKTHAVTRLRRVWLGVGAREIYLNGEYDRTDVLVVRRIVTHLVPIPAGLLREQERAVIANWLIGEGMSGNVASCLAQALCCRPEFSPAELPVEMLGEIVAVLLVQASVQVRVALLFEDLHKCQPSVVELMTNVARSLELATHGRVLLVYTTREHALSEDQKERRLWLQRFGELSLAGKVVDLPPFSRSEAGQLLAKTIPTLAEPDAGEIVQQVGTTPFGLREALAFMRDTGIAQHDQRIGWHVPEPAELRKRLLLSDFERSTFHRLRALRESSDRWLGEILDLGACLGRAFSVTAVAQCSSAPDQTRADDAVARAIRLNVLRRSTRDAEFVEFDHDLIRKNVLEHMNAQRRLAGKLYDHLQDEADDHVLAALAYQAGYAKRCLKHAESNAQRQLATRRYLDLAASLQLALLVTDQNAFQQRTPEEWRDLWWVDEALLVATPVHVGLTSAAREVAVLGILRRLIVALVAVSSGSGESVERAINEALAIAVRRRDEAQRAFLHSQYGLLYCERDQLREAGQQHQKAEEIYAAMADPSLRAERARNLVRLAIVERDSGDIAAARGTLRRALAQRRSGDWELLGSVLANLGGSYFYSDWTQVRRYWERWAAIAHRRGLIEDEVAAIVDVAQLDILEDRLPEASERLSRAERLAAEMSFENVLLRVHLNTACVAMVRNDLLAAEERLVAAERIATSHSVWRRLWRIRANLATVHELAGDHHRALVLDKGAATALLASYSATEEKAILRVLLRRRTALPFANIALRAAESDLWRPLLQQLPNDMRLAAESMCRAIRDGAAGEIPHLLGRHCKRIGEAQRFIVTE